MSNETITVVRQCPMCGNAHIVTVPAVGYRQWTSGMKHIQEAMPEVSEDDREMLMSGICKSCWDKFLHNEE